jgi:hypothetical protein
LHDANCLLKANMSPKAVIFCRSSLTNFDRETDAPISIAATIAYGKGREIHHTERTLGSTVAQLDPDLGVLDSGASLAQLILTSSPASPQSPLSSKPYSTLAHYPGQPFSLTISQTTNNLLSQTSTFRLHGRLKKAH